MLSATNKEKLAIMELITEKQSLHAVVETLNNLRRDPGGNGSLVGLPITVNEPPMTVTSLTTISIARETYKTMSTPENWHPCTITLPARSKSYEATSTLGCTVMVVHGISALDTRMGTKVKSHKVIITHKVTFANRLCIKNKKRIAPSPR